MPSALPPLSAIRVFEAAARHQSFTRAAQELGMTQAAVSYQIKMLEDRIGAPLFRRLPRQVVLTEVGRRLSPPVSEALETLRTAFANAQDTSERVLAINAVHTVATNWLMPRLGDFRFAHPDLAVRLETSQRLVDFAREEADVGIRTGLGTWPGLIAHRLFPLTFTPMASPSLLERHGGVASPADLLRLPIVTPNDYWWRLWFAQAGVSDPNLDHRPAVSFTMQELDGAAAIAGSGVALLTPIFFANELASGRLVQLFDILGDEGHSYWLVYHRDRRRSLKIRAFRDWILAQSASESAPPPGAALGEPGGGNLSHSAAWASPSSARKPPD